MQEWHFSLYAGDVHIGRSMFRSTLFSGGVCCYSVVRVSLAAALCLMFAEVAYGDYYRSLDVYREELLGFGVTDKDTATSFIGKYRNYPGLNYYIGLMYEHGIYVDIDKDKAEESYGLCLIDKFSVCAFNLGLMHYYGFDGGGKNYFSSYLYFMLALSFYDKSRSIDHPLYNIMDESVRRIEVLRLFMTEEELKVAKERAKIFLNF